MKMTLNAVFYDAISKTSAKGNEYQVVRLKQKDSFNYLDVLVKNDIRDELKELFNGGVRPGFELTVLLDYHPKYHSFSLIDVI